jgi:type IV pilus assembly protein PilB
MVKSQKRIGEILVEKGLISKEQLEVALKEQLSTKEFLGEVLLRKKQIEEQDLLKVLSEQFHIAVVTLKDRYIDWKLVKDFSPSLILEYKCFPVEKRGRAVIFAITNPLDAWALKKAEEEARDQEVKFVLASAQEMEEAINRYKQYMRGNISNLF